MFDIIGNYANSFVCFEFLENKKKGDENPLVFEVWLGLRRLEGVHKIGTQKEPMNS